jgi:hypothetical protein
MTFLKLAISAYLSLISTGLMIAALISDFRGSVVLTSVSLTSEVLRLCHSAASSEAILEPIAA